MLTLGFNSVVVGFFLMQLYNETPGWISTVFSGTQLFLGLAVNSAV